MVDDTGTQCLSILLGLLQSNGGAVELVYVSDFQGDATDFRRTELVRRVVQCLVWRGLSGKVVVCAPRVTCPALEQR